VESAAGRKYVFVRTENGKVYIEKDKNNLVTGLSQMELFSIIVSKVGEFK